MSDETDTTSESGGESAIQATSGTRAVVTAAPASSTATTAADSTVTMKHEPTAVDRTRPMDRTAVAIDHTVKLDRAIVLGDPLLPTRFGRYEVRGRIGIGGFATVYAALDPTLDAPVAIKVLAENHAADVEIRRRFITEARVARRLGSDRLIGVYDLGETTDGRPYVVMELADRGTLRARLNQLASPSNACLLRFVDELSACMTAIHARGVVHRDIKPTNLLLRSAGPDDHRPMAPAMLIATDERLVLADFGLARDISTGASALTMGGGTAGYMAPEQAHADGRADHRADIFAATAVLAEIMTGRHPERLDLGTAGLGPYLLHALEQGLALDRDHRPPSAAAWRSLLIEALTREPPEPAEPSPIPSAPPNGRANPTLIGPDEIDATPVRIPIRTFVAPLENAVTPPAPPPPLPPPPAAPAPTPPPPMAAPAPAPPPPAVPPPAAAPAAAAPPVAPPPAAAPPAAAPRAVVAPPPAATPAVAPRVIAAPPPTTPPVVPVAHLGPAVTTAPHPPGTTAPPPAAGGAETRRQLKTAEKLARLERKQHRRLERRRRRRRRFVRVANMFLALVRGALAAGLTVAGIVFYLSVRFGPSEVEEVRPRLVVAVVLAFFFGMAFFPWPRRLRRP